jgi:hypothetical protein
VVWAAALYEPLAFFDLQILNVGPAIVLLLAALERLTAPKRTTTSLALSGLFLGLASITVATFLVFLPVAAAWLATSTRRRSTETPVARRVVAAASFLRGPAALPSSLWSRRATLLFRASLSSSPTTAG